MNSAGNFLDAELMLRLEQISLYTKHRIRGTRQGKRRSGQLGSSLEFADYRPYCPGDDIRQLDWNVYARTGKPFIQLFNDEQELPVHLLIDGSRSMNFGEGAEDANKFLYARKLAACIGYTALAGYDRVSARFFSDRIDHELFHLRGKSSAARLMRFLSEAKPQGYGDIAKALWKPNSFLKRSGIGLTFLLSDFLYLSGVEETITHLQAAGQELVILHVLSPQEMEPSLTGELRLVDSENETGKEVAISSKVLKAYQNEVAHFRHQLQKFCYARDISYAFIRTDNPLQESILKVFRQLNIQQ